MPKLMVTWLGEDELHSVKMEDEKGQEYIQELPGPSFTTWGKTRFEKGKPVLVDSDRKGISEDERLVLDNIIKKAPANRYFKTEAVQERQQSKG